MRELIIVATTCLLGTVAGPAPAQNATPEFGASTEQAPPAEPDPKDEGYIGQLTLGFRAGYALPLGKTTRNGDGTYLDEHYSGHVPLGIDIGYEPLPNLMLGGYGYWGPAFMATATAADGPGCPDGASCFGNVFRGGPQAVWFFLPRAKLDPWVGLGAAYEFAFTRAKLDQDTTRTLNRGAEIINVQAGLDYKPKRQLSIGPFASFSVGRYTNCKTTINGSPGPRCDIEQRAQHEWFLVGARVYFSVLQVKKKGVTL